MSSSLLVSSEASDKEYTTSNGTEVNHERVYSEGIQTFQGHTNIQRAYEHSEGIQTFRSCKCH